MRPYYPPTHKPWGTIAMALRLFMRPLLTAVLAVSLLGMSVPGVSVVQAQEAAGPVAPQVALNLVTSYLNRIRTLRGVFQQISPRGTLTRGTFYLSRPGKMRFEYAPPSTLLLVSDGTWVSVEDRGQKTVDHYPLSMTPLKMLLKDTVNFQEDAKVLEAFQADGVVWVTLEARDRTIPGKLSLGYRLSEKALTDWVVIDAQNRKTIVSLSQVETNIPLQDQLFAVSARPRQERESGR